MIAPPAIMPHIFFIQTRGGSMSAEIVRLIARPKHKQPTDFPAIAFRSAAQPDDLVMDRVDTGACEPLGPDKFYCSSFRDAHLARTRIP
jgi:hypothetical protein